MAIKAPKAPEAIDVKKRQIAAMARRLARWEPLVRDHQNSNAVPRKLKCCKACHHSLSSALSNSDGMCQSHRAHICNAVATAGNVRRRHTRLTLPLLAPSIRTRRSRRGEPPQKTDKRPHKAT